MYSGRNGHRAQILLLLFFCLPLCTATILYLIVQRYRRQIYKDPLLVPPHSVAIVFGAGYYPPHLSTVLEDRVLTAVDLYQQGKVTSLLMTGNNDGKGYDEPGAMTVAALAAGVPPEAIIIDGGGYSTFASLYRARSIFDLREAILVTQSYHLPRALFIAHNLDIRAAGLAAEKHHYRKQFWFSTREIGATLKAYWSLYCQSK